MGVELKSTDENRRAIYSRLRRCSLAAIALYRHVEHFFEFESDRPAHLAQDGSALSRAGLAQWAGLSSDIVGPAVQELIDIGLLAIGTGEVLYSPIEAR